MNIRHPAPEETAPATVSLELNGETIHCPAPGATTLLDLLRASGQVTSTRAGCRIGRCGACQVLLDGRAIPACLVMVCQLSDRRVETVEGLTGDPDFLAIRNALAGANALQCGYCTPGFAVSLVAGLRQRRQGEAGISGRQSVPLHRLRRPQAGH